ncbi:imidazole glycerol phosphate synthase subunit HisH [Marinomonas piezotolerans]|uniref:Imidazole glycerol phosphate synthase subunit HisH n=1 Tax=Marinomonas piezotolerans TaxID=2213058 RepID=A0A370U8F4_9GAMM|nr:imidazole glycerol phosphate synthase subunit HisH [Marinomonas piezotolerans]RDL44023.1 imidazole glycerol phosphate synthase subunit HisH [Marinomonas piezotolerans]
MTQSLKVALIDYGMGNLKSIKNVIAHIGEHEVLLTADPVEIDQADVVFLPGVGAFGDAMKNLRARNLDAILSEQVLVKKKPTIGICLGMQLLFERSAEGGDHQGLGWIPGHVEYLDLPAGFRVPHIGWNDLILEQDNPFFAGLGADSNFYFVHSYHAICDPQYLLATVDYGMKVTAAVQKDNVVGMQFHPEKSQTNGLETMRRFFQWAQEYRHA